MIALLLACGGPPLGQAHRLAQDPAVPLEEAIAACEQLADLDARGDCATAAVEARGGLDPADCDVVPPGLWAEECRFQLAERLREAGRVEQALELCGQNRWARECTFHLVRAEAWEGAGGEVRAAEARLGPLRGAQAAQDADRLFWREWHRKHQVEGGTADPARCEALDDPVPCREAVGELFRNAAAALGWEEVCSRVAQGRPPLSVKGGVPAFAPSPEVDLWVAASCPGR